MSYRRVPKESDELLYIRFGHSLWSAISCQREWLTGEKRRRLLYSQILYSQNQICQSLMNPRSKYLGTTRIMIPNNVLPPPPCIHTNSRATLSRSTFNRVAKVFSILWIERAQLAVIGRLAGSRSREGWYKSNRWFDGLANGSVQRIHARVDMDLPRSARQTRFMPERIFIPDGFWLSRVRTQ